MIGTMINNNGFRLEVVQNQSEHDRLGELVERTLFSLGTIGTTEDDLWELIKMNRRGRGVKEERIGKVSARVRRTKRELATAGTSQNYATQNN